VAKDLGVALVGGEDACAGGGPTPYGLTIEVPTRRILRLVKSDDRFVGVFLNFGVTTSPKVLPPPSVSVASADGHARVAFTSPLAPA
jgi:hypothetical protein